MRKNFFKQIGTGFICAIMLMVLSISAFATNAMQENYDVTTDKGTVLAEYTFNVDTNGSASTLGDYYDNDPVITDVPSFKTGYLYPNLSKYFGLTKAFHVSTSSDQSSCGIFLYLYNPDGDLVSDDWSMGVNDYAYLTLFLPSSGTYTLKIVNMSDETVNVAAFWEG